MTESYFTTLNLFYMVAFLPTAAILLSFMFTRDLEDSLVAFLVFTLSTCLTGVITNIIKLSVGRHRPDFIFRCWPDGVVPEDALSSSDLQCTGHPDVIKEGRKSFPSGHSSFSFATWGFLFFYLSGKLGTFRCGSRPASAWRLLVSVSLLLVPTVLAISRTADYHHHWQDVTVGSLLGFAVVWMVYRQYYPPLSSTSSNLPLPYNSLVMTNKSRMSDDSSVRLLDHI
jgi:diacylglycerol diphosphate phosphatase/phosphatidate phosphatase